MARKSMVVCTSCGQPVSANEAELVWEDPDDESDEYVCSECSGDEADMELGFLDDYQSAGIDDFEY